MEETTLMIIKVVGVFIAIVSMLTGIFMPILLNMTKRNAKSNDEKLSILYTGQQKTIDAISDIKLKVNDTENKTRQNYGTIKELKATTKWKFENIEKRLERQGDLALKNKSKIEEVVIIQKNYSPIK